jgi:hypothetical protein
MKHYDTIKCQICQGIFKNHKASFNKHQKMCIKLQENDNNIINDYSSGISSWKIAKKYKIDSFFIRKLLKKNGFLNLDSRNKVNRDFFKNKTNEMFWLLGLISSDGCIYNKNLWGITQSGNNGKKLIEYIKKILNHSNKISCFKTIRENAYSIKISSSEMICDLKNIYNIHERKTYDLKFNKIIFEGNEEYFKSFLRGYIDGDGCVGVYDNGKGIKTLNIGFVGNKEYIEEIEKHIKIKCSSKSKLKNVYQIVWYGENAVRFGSWLYSNDSLYSHYKKENFFNYINGNDIPNWSNYNKIYLNVKNRLNSENIMKLSSEFNIAFQTLYKWKSDNRNYTIEKIGNFYFKNKSYF